MPNKRSYCFTHWKFPEKIKYYFLEIIKNKNCRYIVGQIEEAPISKKHHIQGYAEFIGKESMSYLRNVMSNCHIESRKGSRVDARKYCMKEESRIEGPYEYGDFSIGGQGRRLDIKDIKDDVSAGKSIVDILESRDLSYSHIRMLEKYVEYTQKKRNRENPPIVKWYWGASGTGKTRSVYEEFPESNIYESISFRWWDGYSQQEVILIDDMRRDYAKYHIILRLLDRYPLMVEVKGGHTQINSKYIIITSAYHPKDLYETREDINQLLRRITIIRKFEKKKPKNEILTQLNMKFNSCSAESVLNAKRIRG